jgi:hypothetical protein
MPDCVLLIPDKELALSANVGRRDKGEAAEGPQNKQWGRFRLPCPCQLCLLIAEDFVEGGANGSNQIVTAGRRKMSKFMKGVLEFTGEIFVSALGWLVCLFFLFAAYGVGSRMATYFGHGDHRDMAGLLCALALVWIYEHRNIEEKYEHLRTSIALTPQH